MGEPGVSRIVSVKVNDSAIARSDALSQKTMRPTADGQAPAGAVA
jgi:hypothetical protein